MKADRASHSKNTSVSPFRHVSTIDRAAGRLTPDQPQIDLPPGQDALDLLLRPSPGKDPFDPITRVDEDPRGHILCTPGALVVVPLLSPPRLALDRRFRLFVNLDGFPLKRLHLLFHALDAGFDFLGTLDHGLGGRIVLDQAVGIRREGRRGPLDERVNTRFGSGPRGCYGIRDGNGGLLGLFRGIVHLLGNPGSSQGAYGRGSLFVRRQGRDRGRRGNRLSRCRWKQLPVPGLQNPQALFDL